MAAVRCEQQREGSHCGRVGRHAEDFDLLPFALEQQAQQRLNDKREDEIAVPMRAITLGFESKRSRSRTTPIQINSNASIAKPTAK